MKTNEINQKIQNQFLVNHVYFKWRTLPAFVNSIFVIIFKYIQCKRCEKYVSRSKLEIPEYVNGLEPPFYFIIQSKVLCTHGGMVPRSTAVHKECF